MDEVRNIQKAYRVLSIAIPIFFLLCVFLCFDVAAAEIPDSLVAAEFTIHFDSGTALSLSISMDVEKLTTDRVYYKNEIKTASDQEMGALRYELFLELRSQLRSLFSNSEITEFEMPIFDGSLFHEQCTLMLTSQFFNLNESINPHELINGAFDMGALISYSFTLPAYLGWNNTYNFILSNQMSLDFADTTNTNVNENRVTWTINNWNGEKPSKPAQLKTRYSTPTTKENNEDIRLHFNVDTRNVKNVSLTSSINAYVIDISPYTFLPEFITELRYVPSDGIRLFIANNLLTWDELYNTTLHPITTFITTSFENSSLNQTLSTQFIWNKATTLNCTAPYNTTKMDTAPPLISKIVDNDIRLIICHMPSRAFFGLLNAGATATITATDINFGDNLPTIAQSYPYTVTLKLPQNILLETNNEYTFDNTSTIAGTFTSEKTPQPPYTNEHIETIIEINIEKLELNLLSFFTGKTELTSTLNSHENTKYHITKLPTEFRLNKKINITYLNADAFRICIEEAVFTPAATERFLENTKTLFEEKIQQIFPSLTIKGHIDNQLFTNSLHWDGDISSMDSTEPVITSNYAHNLQPINFDLALLPPSIDISNQQYILQPTKNQLTTYRIIYPKGISIKVIDSNNQSVPKGKTEDGRPYIELSFNKDSPETRTITCKMTASALYMIGLFLPCILSLILVIILLIVVFIIRKKRGGWRRTKAHHEPETGYEDQDYYVPPASK